MTRSAIVSVAVEKIGGCFSIQLGALKGIDQWVVTWVRRGSDSQLWDVIDVECNVIESVADVQFDEVDRSKGWVC